MKVHRFLIVILFTCISCFEEDTIMKPDDETGELVVGTAEMSDYYKYQIFFNLETNTSISQNLFKEWDLGFEASDSGWHVILNSAKMMLAGNTGKTVFEAAVTETGLKMYFDPSDRAIDSTAIGKWYYFSGDMPVSYRHVYIIDRGRDENGVSLGKKKVMFDIASDSSYLVRYAGVDGQNEETVVIRKDNTGNFVCFSFDNGIVNIEPPKESWDLLFTKYSTMLYSAGEPYPYLVTGVLLNPYKVSANVDSLYTFDEVTFARALEYPLLSRKDIIGYDWKTYDFDNATYTVNSSKIYIVRNHAGDYYKLRFIDFYNTGKKVTFEFVLL